MRDTFFSWNISFNRNHRVTLLVVLFSFYIILCTLLSSCGSRTDPSSKAAVPTRVKSKEIKNENSTSQTEADTAIEVMDEKEIRFNGQLKRYFSFKEFQLVLGKPDSTKLLSEIEPCTTIFQEADGSVDPEARYLYKNGSRFECSRGKVAIDQVRFSDGDFLIFHHQSLNKNTTVSALKKLFPNAAKYIADIDVADEGKLQVMLLREDKDNVSDGHIKIFIKNGKLYSMHWWFPC
ncbi:hypothetical protein KHS38_13195 [Mucilaginibacter sp. Bleaf8]|uniref:hypothetical protein n=1 Tax=Mucilaginibacter sp. Bleaf8 TaxID=2834430 RepID=UPI001BCE2C82|nr:hypothetical protein [Mucilaginibacter sp. Bleaf8]MBS7565361.1 hypothetical protein [Mucilaginibacter sp. Bleaf8]